MMIVKKQEEVLHAEPGYPKCSARWSRAVVTLMLWFRCLLCHEALPDHCGLISQHLRDVLSCCLCGALLVGGS